MPVGFPRLSGRLGVEKQRVLAWGFWMLHAWKSPLEGGVVCKCPAHGLSPDYQHQLVLVTLAEGILAVRPHCHSEKEQCCCAGKTQQPGSLPETLMSIRCCGISSSEEDKS